MGLTITLGVLLLLILWVLFTPIILQIDTVNHQYYLKMTGIVTITPFLNEEGFKLSIRTPFYAFRIAPKRSKEKWQRKKYKSSSEIVSLSKMFAII